jgi:glycosyltransferase involved in cell wall biosynthesis
VRILFVSAEYPPVSDGIGTYVAGVAPALAARGHEVHVLSCLPGQARSDRLDGAVHVHRRGLLPLRGPGRLGVPPLVVERLRTALTALVHRRRLGRFDVIEVPDFLAEGLGLAIARGTALVAHLHTPLGLVTQTSELPLGRAERAGDALERFAARRAHVLTSPSQILVERLERTGWLSPRPWYRHGAVRIVRYPIDGSRWAGVPPVEGSDPVVLAVGRLERRKAPETLLEACALLAEDLPGLELVFVGRSEEERDGLPYARWLERRAERAGVRCRVVEQVPNDALGRWYGRARVVALASRFDNFPMVALEALACGRPVVCTDATGTAEILAGSGAGAVVPVGDPSALAEGLRPYLADAVLAARAGQAARELVANVCAPASVAREREAVYLEARGRARSPR